jgi:hypothetical protein
MPELVYTPDADLRVHEEGAIKLICKPFQSHENGMPEWVKNCADEYARSNAPESRRVIVIMFDHGRKNAPSSISCLDFGGMTSAVIERISESGPIPRPRPVGVVPLVFKVDTATVESAT